MSVFEVAASGRGISELGAFQNVGLWPKADRLTLGTNTAKPATSAFPRSPQNDRAQRRRPAIGRRRLQVGYCLIWNVRSHGRLLVRPGRRDIALSRIDGSIGGRRLGGRRLGGRRFGGRVHFSRG